MNDEEIKRRGEQIQNEMSAHLSKSLNMPVVQITQESIDTLLTEIKKLPNIEKKYSQQELHEEVGSFLSQMLIFRPKNETEVLERIKKFTDNLEKEKDYEAIIFLHNIIGLPVGTKLGHLEIIDESVEDKVFIEFLKYHEEHDHIITGGRSQARVKFKAYTTERCTSVFYKILELPFAILSLLFNLDLSSKDCIGYIHSPEVNKKYFVKPERPVLGWARYHNDFGGQLERLSNLSLDKKPTSLQQKIIQALQVYGLSRLSQKEEIRFLFLVSAFESLLLTESDRDYLGKKISEKTAFLVEGEYEKRLQLYKKMKDLYGKRSGLVHRGKIKISDPEIKDLDVIFQAVAFKLLEMSDSYTSMEQKSGDKKHDGVEDYINKLKFS